VAGTPGAELHHALDPTPIDAVVDKGQDPATEGYSGFEGTELAALLREHDVDHVTVVGLATDYCVKNTALDALREGFSVTVDSTATRGVDVEPDDSARALEAVRAAGASVA
jgi:nicotinamidase/pyrazinamidase